ncbi:MAG: hypothetical protein V7L04_30850 [Nostoc sp.]|uniref:hypothetical protein n=1 Tax=Nostoc sp. TaxID=1180 RepID=UPI002FF60DDF
MDGKHLARWVVCLLNFMGKGQTRPLTVVNSARVGIVVQEGRVPHIIKTVFDRIRNIFNIGGARQHPGAF